MESGGKDRIHVYPSRVALIAMKNRLTMSEKGANLLQKRADALAFHYRTKSNKTLRNILEMQLAAKKARISIAEANFIAGNQNHQILETIGHVARLKLKINLENIAGVKLVDFETVQEAAGTDRSKFLGLGRGAERLNRCRTAFRSLIDLIMQQATLRYSLKVIDKTLSATNCRINGLKNVVVPRLQNTIRYIISELDEEEREEHFRRKKVQMKKRIIKNAEMEKRRKALAII